MEMTQLKFLNQGKTNPNYFKKVLSVEERAKQIRLKRYCDAIWKVAEKYVGDHVRDGLDVRELIELGLEKGWVWSFLDALRVEGFNVRLKALRLVLQLFPNAGGTKLRKIVQWWCKKGTVRFLRDRRYRRRTVSKLATKGKRAPVVEPSTAVVVSKQTRKSNVCLDSAARKLETIAKLNFQCGGGVAEDKASRRARREAQYRKEAKQAAKERYKKAFSKEERHFKVREQRDKRNPAFVEEQVGGVLKSVLLGASSVLAATVSVAARRVGILANKAGTLTDSVNSCIETIKKAVAAFMKHVGPAFGKSAVVMIFWYCTKLIPLPAAAKQLLWVPLLVTLFGKDLWEAVSEFFHLGDSKPTVCEQAGGAGGPMAKIFATTMVFSALKVKRGDAITELTKRLSLLDRVCSGWQTFIDWFIEAFEACVNFVRGKLGKDSISWTLKFKDPVYQWMKGVDKSSADVAEWLKKVDSSSSSLATAGVDIDAKMLDELVDQVRVGYGFKEAARGSAVSKEIDTYTLRAAANLQPFLGALQARNNFRFQPEMALFTGAPGVGKTAICVPFTAAVLKLSGLVSPEADFEEAVRNMWQKGDTKYWNGYAQQAALIIDDAFQEKVIAGQEGSEFMDIIRMVGTWSFPLNFADVASKGRIYFGSRFILGTTNMTSLRSQASTVINEPSAVFRRIGHAYRMYVRPEFAKENGELDYDKLSQEMIACKDKQGLDRYPWHVWYLRRHNFDTNVTDAHHVSVKEVIVQIALILRKRRLAFEQDKATYADFFQGIKVQEQAGGLLPHFQQVRGAATDFTSAAWHKCVDSSIKVFREENRVWKRIFAFATCTAVSVIVVKLGLQILVSTMKKVLSTLFGASAKILRRDRRVHFRQQSNAPPVRVRLYKPGPQQPVQEQVATPHLTDIVTQNCYKMTVNNYQLGTIAFVESNLAVQPAHFTRHLKKWIDEGKVACNDSLKFTHVCNPLHDVSFRVDAYLAMQRHTLCDSDVEFLVFPSMRAHRSIMGFLLKESQMEYVQSQVLTMTCADLKLSLGERVTSTIVSHTFSCQGYQRDFNYYADGENLHLDRHWRYLGVPTVSGDCGSPITFRDSSAFNAVWIGFHIAVQEGVKPIGLGAILTREMAEKARTALFVVKDSMLDDLERKGIKMQMSDLLPFPDTRSFLPIGRLAKGIALAPYTSYYPTHLFGAWGDFKKLPALLRPKVVDGVTINPMFNAVRPYSSPVVHYSQPWLRQAMYTATIKLRQATADTPRRIFTYKEAIEGIPELGYNALPKNTSPGFPYIHQFKAGKKEIWGSGAAPDYGKPGAKLIEKDTMELLEAARKGERLAILWYDFMKDELRAPEKVKMGATRLISCGPMHYVLACRMMFSAFVQAFLDNHIDTATAPGIAVYSGWDRLAQYLRSKGDKVFDGDFKGFDASQQPVILELILEFINEWYDDGPENALIRKVLWEDLVHSRHIGGDGSDQTHVYQWNKCLPSGHPLTTVVNSIYSLFLLVAAYVSATGDLVGFWTHVAPMTFGDDNITNVDDATAPVYNQKTVAAALAKEFGLIYTPGAKNADFVETMPLEDTTFLKRTFRYSPSTGWYGPLDPDSFLYTAYYCKNRKLEPAILKDDLEIAMQELSLHPDLWRLYADKVYKSFARVGNGAIPLCPCSREAYMAWVLSRKDNGW